MPAPTPRNPFLIVPLAALALACAWESEEATDLPVVEHPGGGIEKGAPGPTTDPTIAYPVGPYGHTIGTTVQNFQFLGFQNPKSANYKANEYSITTIRLADYYNPNEDPDKPVVLLLNASAGWCPVCKEEAKQSMIHYAHWKAKGVEFMTAIFENDDAQPAEFTDIENWGMRHALEYPLVLDPKLTLGVFFNKSASPFNMIVDLRTMRIVFTTEGLIDLGPNNPPLQAFAR
jgi:hypothetical protein